MMRLNIQKFADGKIVIDTEINSKNFENGLNRLKTSASAFGDVFKANIASEAVIRVFDNIVGKIKNVSSAIGNMVVQGGIDRALNLENAKAKMSTFTKSADQLDTIMQNVSNSVDGTAFSMDAAATVAAGLFAAGVKEGEEMETSLKLVADAAQVSGRSMEDMGSIFNKVAANGKLTGEELNQLSDSGIPIVQLLADSMGKSAEEVRKLVSAGKVGFPEFQKAMEDGLGGAAQNAGQTFTSSLANVKSAMSRMGAEIMEPLLQGVTPVMNTFKDMIKNMVSGEDISGEITKLFSQLETFANAAATHLTEMINKYMPVINQMLQGLLQMIPQLLPTLIPMITQLITSVVTLIIENAPLILNAVLQIILQVALSLATQLPTLIPILVKALLNMVDAIINNIDLFIDAAIALIIGLAEGLIQAIPKLIEKAPVIIEKLVAAIIRNLPKIIQMGITLIIKLAQGLIQAIPQLVSKIPQIIKAILNGITNGGFSKMLNAGKQLLGKIKDGILGAISGLFNIGKNIVQGIWNGISNATGWIMGKIAGFAKGIVNGIKGFLGIKSPSKVMRDQVGKWLPPGIYEGFEDELDSTYSKMQRAIDMENSKLQANIETGKVFNTLANTTPVHIQIDADVEMDKTKVGRIITPTVSETLKTGGLR